MIIKLSGFFSNKDPLDDRKLKSVVRLDGTDRLVQELRDPGKF